MIDLALGIVISALAAARLWRLAAEDIITDRPRVWLLNRSPMWVKDMVECPWCLGTHLSVVMWALWELLPASQPFIAMLAVAHLTGLVGRES